MNDNIFRIGGVALKYLFGVIGFALGLFIAIKGNDAGGLINFALYLVYIVMVLAILIIFAALIYDIVVNLKKRLPMIIGAAAFIVIAFIAYLIASDDVVPFKALEEEFGTIDPSTVKKAGGGLITTYILMIVAIGAIAFGGIRKLMNR